MDRIDKSESSGARKVEYTERPMVNISEPFLDENPRFQPDLQAMTLKWIHGQLGFTKVNHEQHLGIKAKADLPIVRPHLQRTENIPGINPDQTFVVLEPPIRLGISDPSVSSDPAGSRAIAEGYAAALGGNARVKEIIRSSPSGLVPSEYHILLPIQVRVILGG